MDTSQKAARTVPSAEMLRAVVRSVWYPVSRIEVLNNMYKTILAVFVQKQMGRRWRTHGPLTLLPVVATGHYSVLSLIIVLVVLHSLPTINQSMSITFYCLVSHDILVSSSDLSSDPSQTQPPQHPLSVFAYLRKRTTIQLACKQKDAKSGSSVWLMFPS